MPLAQKPISTLRRALHKTWLYQFFTYVPPKSEMGEILQSALEHPDVVLPHLNDLRRRLLWIMIFLGIGCVAAFIFVTPIMEILAKPLPGGLSALRGVDVTEPVGAVMWVVVLAGFIFSFPITVVQIWLYFVPGMSGRERLITVLALPAAILFFVAGVAFTYFVLLPQALPFLTSFMDLQTDPRPITYFPFVVNLMLWIGLSFEFPMVAMTLARMGLLTAKDLLKFWRYAVVVIAIFAAMITTTVDPANMFLAMLPMVVLYFLSIGLVRLVEKPKKND